MFGLHGSRSSSSRIPGQSPISIASCFCLSHHQLGSPFQQRSAVFISRASIKDVTVCELRAGHRHAELVASVKQRIGKNHGIPETENQLVDAGDPYSIYIGNIWKHHETPN
jgi:hypothetical protein